MNVLIAEDDQLMQLLNSNIMEIWGYHYDLAFNGHEAVELALNSRPKYDICLMDIEMPKMSGIDAARAIKQSNINIPIIAYTADTIYKKECIEVGMDDYIEKPCPPEQLFRIIQKLTTKQESKPSSW